MAWSLFNSATISSVVGTPSLLSIVAWSQTTSFASVPSRLTPEFGRRDTQASVIKISML